jgi:hypothetical protein
MFTAGYCLNQCPTYHCDTPEPESPRGRIHLVAAAAGRIELSAPLQEHIYLCLLCRAGPPALQGSIRPLPRLRANRSVRLIANFPRHSQLVFTLAGLPAAFKALARLLRNLPAQWLASVA